MIDGGATEGIAAASPVIDASGVIGQVTRVYPLSAEVMLMTDKDAAIPVINLRTQARAVAFGDPGSLAAGAGMAARRTASRSACPARCAGSAHATDCSSRPNSRRASGERGTVCSSGMANPFPHLKRGDVSAAPQELPYGMFFIISGLIGIMLMLR